MYLIGIDPGLAKIGLALVHHDGERTLESVRLIETAKDDSRKVAVTADDNRRFFDLATQFLDFLDQVPRNEKVMVGIEGFAYIPGAGPNLLKTAQAVGVIKGILCANRMMPFEFKSSEVKVRVCGAKSASKTDVQTVLEKEYPNLHELLEAYPKGKREHLADAVAMAHCAFEEYAQRRLYVGGIL